MSKWCNFTASKSERAQECPASFALDEVASKAGYPAQRGTFGHSYLEAGLRGSQEDADIFLFTKEERVPSWWISDMQKISVESVRDKLYALHEDAVSDLYLEAAYCLESAQSDISEVRYLGQSIGRNYPKGSEFSGSIDVNILSDNSATIVDFKFGSQPINEECLQLRNLAVMVQEFEDLDRVKVSIAQFDKANNMSLPDELPTKTYSRGELEVARKDLDATITSINEARRRVTLGEQVAVNPGSWCKWCDCTGCEFYKEKR